MMKLVKSKVFGDCGVCAVATLTGDSYEEVCKSSSFSNGTFIHLSIAEVHLQLAKRGFFNGLCFWNVKIDKGCQALSGEVSTDLNAILTVRNGGVLHFAVWDGVERNVIDSSCGIVGIDHYPEIENWTPIQEIK